VKDLQRARACLEAGTAPAARSAMRKAVETANDLPQALSDYAQLMAAQGDWAEAARFLEQAVHFAPASWDARLRLVDAWIAAGQPDKASQALAELRAVFPAHPQLQERADGIEVLMQGQAAGAGTAPGGAEDQVDRTSAAGEAPTGRSPAVETLELLLGAEDLLAALELYAERLDEGLLELVRQNERSARAAGDEDLAAGLEALEEYIEAEIASRPGSQEDRAQETLRLILEAGDLRAALELYSERPSAAGSEVAEARINGTGCRRPQAIPGAYVSAFSP
jgi:hypothetical protein